MQRSGAFGKRSFRTAAAAAVETAAFDAADGAEDSGSSFGPLLTSKESDLLVAGQE